MKKFFQDIIKYREYAVYSAKSSLKVEVADSYLNWLWWILDPLLLMLVYMFIGQVIFKSKIDAFPIFVFLGLTLWNFFNKNVMSSIKLIRGKKTVISKVYMPKFVLIFSKMVDNFIKMAICLGIVFIMMPFWNCKFTLQLFILIPIILTLIIFTFGCSTICMHFGVFIDDLYNVVQVALKLIFYMTGIFFSIEDRLQATHPYWGKVLSRYNPLAFLITSARKVVLTNNFNLIDCNYLIAWLIIGCVLSVIGVNLIYKYENGYVKVI